MRDGTAKYNQKFNLWISITILSVSAIFLFSRLGHYALWDDEAMTGLIAQGVLKTGDTSAVLDHNIVAYGEGLLLLNLKDRSTSPFSAYTAALSIGLFGRNALAARLPFALFGLGCISLMVYWAIRQRVRPTTLILLGIAIIGNISLFLFCRNARYYAPAILTSTAVAWFYSNWTGKPSQFAGVIFCSLILLASNYMEFFALYSCLAIDYLFWSRKTKPLSWRDLFVLALPQMILGGVIVLIWNPWATGTKANFMASSLDDRLRSIPAFVRDLNVCEFGLGVLFVIAPLLYLRRRNLWLIRIPVALLIYVVGIALVSPMKSSGILAGLSQVRYVCPTIPLWIALGVIVTVEAVGAQRWAVVPLGILVFWSNLASLNWLLPFPFLKIEPHSSLVEYVGELAAPPDDPYTLTADWINQNLKPGQSVWVRPNNATYPLMFHAPKVTYAWQLRDSAKPEYTKLPAIHFAGKEAPDYMIAFYTGAKAEVLEMIDQMRSFGYRYRTLPPINCFGRDLYRPELYLRVFKPITNFDVQTHAIYIFERTTDASNPK